VEISRQRDYERIRMAIGCGNQSRRHALLTLGVGLTGTDVVKGDDLRNLSFQLQGAQFFQKRQHRPARSSVEHTPPCLCQERAGCGIVAVRSHERVDGRLLPSVALNPYDDWPLAGRGSTHKIKEDHRSFGGAVHLAHQDEPKAGPGPQCAGAGQRFRKASHGKA
jgi:hypothetical protein